MTPLSLASLFSFLFALSEISKVPIILVKLNTLLVLMQTMYLNKLVYIYIDIKEQHAVAVKVILLMYWFIQHRRE